MKYNQPYGVSDPDAPYINGNPSTGTMGSIPPAASIEYPQREIVNLISDAGLANPDNSDLRQLSKAVQSMLLISDDDAGTANAYQVTMTPAPGAYFKYMTVVTKIGNSNTGASVLNVNAMGPKPIKHPADNSELAAGELVINALARFIFDGTVFHLVWTSGGTIGSTGDNGGGGGGTIYLTRPVDFYVNGTTGDDTYDGLTAAFTNGIHGPFKTLQRASNVINRYNLNGFNVNVHVADGNYASFVLPSPSGTGVCTWTGNLANPTNCVIYSDSRTAVAGSQIGNQTLQGFRLQSTGVYTTYGDPLCCIYISGNNSTLSIAAIVFNGSPGAMVSVGRSAMLTFAANTTFTITGSSMGNPSWIGGFIYAFAGGNVQSPTTNPPTVSITAAISLTQFICASINAMAQLYVASFPGAGNVTGSKYYATLNGVINSSSSGANYYPGSTAGQITSGGQYA